MVEGSLCTISNVYVRGKMTVNTQQHLWVVVSGGIDF